MPSINSFLWNFKRLGPVSWTKCAIKNALLVAGESWEAMRRVGDIGSKRRRIRIRATTPSSGRH